MKYAKIKDEPMWGEVEIVDTLLQNGKQLCRVHPVDFPTLEDRWIEESKLLDVTEELKK